jgi:signal transduction histidine kinase
VANQPLGALYVYLFEERTLSQLELLMLDNFVNQAAMAIYHARRLTNIQRDLTRKDDELIRLHRAGLLISSRPRLKETLETILEMALEVTNARYGIFRLVDKRGRNLISHAVAGEELNRPLVETLPIRSTSVMGWVAQHHQPLLIPDLRAKPWSEIYYPLDSDLEMRSELAVPLINASGRLEGVLNLESPRVRAFSEQDNRLLQALAAQAVIAIQEIRLLDALQEVTKHLMTLPRQEVLDHLVELACDLLNAAASVIWILEDDELIAQATSIVHPRGDRVPLSRSLAGQAILSGGPVTADDVRTDERFSRRDLARKQGWTHALVVPMLSADSSEPVGSFSVYGTEQDPGRFAESEWDNKILTILAHYAALAVQSAARQEALQTAQEQRSVAETFAAIGDIAANLLHHLNNKVGTIPVRVQGIEDKCQLALRSDPYLAKNLQEIERSAFEAMEAVRDNLYHLRPIHLTSISVDTCVVEAVKAVSPPDSVLVQSEDLAALPPVVAGERALTLVFTNLLDNAVRAMEGKGRITITGTERDGWAEVAVSDDGPGIAPERHDRIFELDFSARNSRRQMKLGFGLWWVKTLMTRLGGSVTVESDGQQGTTFRLKLPCLEDTPE